MSWVVYFLFICICVCKCLIFEWMFIILNLGSLGVTILLNRYLKAHFLPHGVIDFVPSLYLKVLRCFMSSPFHDSRDGPDRKQRENEDKEAHTDSQDSWELRRVHSLIEKLQHAGRSAFLNLHHQLIGKIC